MVLLRPALRSTASPQTVLRRTIDPSPSSVFSGTEHCRPGLGGGFGGWVGQRFGPYVGFRCKHTYDTLKSRSAGGPIRGELQRNGKRVGGLLTPKSAWDCVAHQIPSCTSPLRELRKANNARFSSIVRRKGRTAGSRYGLELPPRS